tara:strand:- start:36 stop:230 length:195 start_codon:yes stop_codon:yes gene_type:complete
LVAAEQRADRVVSEVVASCFVENIVAVAGKNYFENQNYLVCGNLKDGLYYLETENLHRRALFHC